MYTRNQAKIHCKQKNLGKEKYFLKFAILGKFCLENQIFSDIFLMKITFFKHFCWE